MRTILLFLALYLNPFLSKSQSIETNFNDGQSFLIETSWEKVLFGFAGNSFYRLKVSDSVASLDFKYIFDCNVSEDNLLYFTFDNDSTIAIRSDGNYFATRGGGAVGMMSSNTIGVNAKYRLRRPICDFFTTHLVKSIRFTNSRKDKHFNVDSKYAMVLRKSFILILPYVKI